MNKIYNRSDIEIKARELLSPMKGVCPDNVWKELNYRLNEENSKSEKAWINTLYTPKMLALAIVSISIITLLLWKLLPGVNNNQSAYKNISNTPQKAVQVAKEEINNSIASSVINDSALSKSNIAANKDHLKKEAAIASVSGNATIQNANVRGVGYNLNNRRDTLSHKTTFTKQVRYTKDSSVSKVQIKRDTLAEADHKKVSSDSVISIAKEQ